MSGSGAFGADFQLAVKTLVNIHHSVYPFVPPQGIYFEALVETAFRQIKKPFSHIKPTTRNQPTHDLLVEGLRISLKTETGQSTNRKNITITKLCTTERDPWDGDSLKHRVMEHLSRYDMILMLRAVWDMPLIHYQLLEIPVDLLRMIGGADLQVIQRRKGTRKSLAADVAKGEHRLYRVHFDGSDGKCSIRGLAVDACDRLIEWDLQVER